MIHDEIETLLRNKIGLNPETLGSRAIATAVNQRMKSAGITDRRHYLQQLYRCPREMDALIESVVVPETWFFRNEEAFNFLRHYVIFEWIPHHSHRALRVLSIPCSTGEEPFSIAITLLDAALRVQNFHIDAVDISKQALQKAKRGVYRKNSFRGQNISFRDRYGWETPEGYHLSPQVRKSVNFIHGNLLNPLFLYHKPAYDIIFCRNLLIYFDVEARQRAVQILERLLAPTGLLFVGSAEVSALSGRFISLRHPMTWVYRKADPRGDRAENRKISAPGAPPVAIAPPPISYSPVAEKPAPTPNPTPESLLDTARNLADNGRLHEAANLCETYLRQNRTDADAYVLLGEVQGAAGNEELAEQSFQKAIYLDPNHVEALLHLALLKEHQGEIASASGIRQRIARLLKLQGE